jgi:hypothetical protein
VGLRSGRGFSLHYFALGKVAPGFVSGWSAFSPAALCKSIKAYTLSGSISLQVLQLSSAMHMPL